MHVFDRFGSSPFSVNEIRTPDEIAESSIWSRLKETALFQFHSAISRVKFSPVPPYSVVILSGLSGPWIDGRTRQHRFSFAKSKSPFSAVAFRQDGVLIALGREDGAVDTYPTQSHQTLHRRWKLNSGIVFSLAFSPFANEIIAGCRNGRIQIIDISSRGNVSSFEGHSDAVMCVESLESGNLWISGSTDGTVKLWNFGDRSEISEVKCQNPVTHIVVRRNRVFAATGESVVVIDIGQKLSVVCDFSAHTRPIVGLCVVRLNLVTASADRTIKVFDPTSFGLLHTLKLHSDVAAFDARPDGSGIAIALSEGIVQMRFMSTEIERDAKIGETLPMPANFRVFKREPPKREAPWNRALRKFNVADALDRVLENGDNAEIVGLIDELDRVGKLHAAIAGRDSHSLMPLLRFLIANAVNSMWSHIVLKAVITVEKIYRDVIVDDPTIGELFEEMVRVISVELETQQRASKIVGRIEILLSMT
jgi:U3 small nucleolar RNA-associated protein 15